MTDSSPLSSAVAVHSDAATPVRPAPGGPRRRGSLIGVGGVVAVSLLVWLLATGFGRDPRLVRSVLIGRPAPAFVLPGVDGGRTSSADFAGRPYVVNFWATWCVACRREHPYLMEFAGRWAPRGVAMVGVVYQDSAEAVRGFRAQMATPYPDVLDPGGRTALDFGVYGVPETFVVDARGIVVAKLIGEARPGSLDRVVGPLVGSG